MVSKKGPCLIRSSHELEGATCPYKFRAPRGRLALRQSSARNRSYSQADRSLGLSLEVNSLRNLVHVVNGLGLGTARGNFASANPKYIHEKVSIIAEVGRYPITNQRTHEAHSSIFDSKRTDIQTCAEHRRLPAKSD